MRLRSFSGRSRSSRTRRCPMGEVATTFPDVDSADERRLGRAAAAAERARQDRDALIVMAFTSGAGLREIARATKLSHQGIKKILERNAEDPSLVAEFERRQEKKRAFNEIKNRQRRAAEESHRKR